MKFIGLAPLGNAASVLSLIPAFNRSFCLWVSRLQSNTLKYPAFIAGE